MLYYGDASRPVAPPAAAAELAAAARAAFALPPGLGRHARLAGLLVDAGELAQAIADEAFARAGADDDDRASAAAMAAAVAVAGALHLSWSTGFARCGPRPDEALEALAGSPLPVRATVRVPEGYAHYALYPELHAEAAERLRREAPGEAVVIGIRSVGTGLAAAAAAALRATAVETVRPVGHPWSRELRLGPALTARLRAAAGRGALFAVADEGPGLSGSSFVAVLRALDALGVAPARAVLLPSHPHPPGHAAGEEGRARYAAAPRRLVAFDEAIAPRLAGWAEPLCGAAREVRDLSGGAWRAEALGADRRGWPPVFAQAEKRKVLLLGPRGAALLRFAGLGRHGDGSLARARTLAEAGFAPPVLGLAHGFTAERWIPRAAAAGARGPSPGEEELVPWLARYLAFRARTLAPGPGASASALLELVRVNAREALGEEAARAAEGLAAAAPGLDALPRTAVDGKLERWEWLRAGDGRLLKSDGVDHAFGHDLVGSQPAAWDVVGAGAELGLSAAGREELLGRLAAAGSPPPGAAAMRLLEAAYLAHRAGRWTFARDTAGDDDDRARAEAARAGYVARLRELLGRG